MSILSRAAMMAIWPRSRDRSGSWEATSPYVTAVGGTSLALYDKSGSKAEWAGHLSRLPQRRNRVSNGKKITSSGAALPFTYYSAAVADRAW